VARPELATKPADQSNALAPPGLAEQIEGMRRKDDRFAGIRVQVDGNIAYLSGLPAQAEDLMILAQIVSPLPGVRKVVVRYVPSEPDSRLRRHP
jgi:hypothetical protein